MIDWSRLLFTSVLFVAVLGGWPRAMPRSLVRLGLDWNQLVDCYQQYRDGNQIVQHLEEQEALLSPSCAEKEALVVQLLQGKSSLVKTAERFRQLDKEVPFLARIRSGWTDVDYCQNVIDWTQAVLHSKDGRWNPTIPQQLQSQLNGIVPGTVSNSRIAARGAA